MDLCIALDPLLIDASLNKAEMGETALTIRLWQYNNHHLYSELLLCYGNPLSIIHSYQISMLIKPDKI